MKLLILLCFLLQSGNAAFEQGEYGKAISLYQSEIEKTGGNASLFYNLGNSYYRTGKYGEAIFAYEKARLLDPRSSDIRANLALARKAAASFEEESGWMKIPGYFSYNEWLRFAVICLIFLAVASLLYGFGYWRRIPFVSPVILSLASIGLVLSVAVLILRAPELKTAIVTAESANVRLSPFATADVTGTLKAGQAVEIEKSHDGFYRVDGGWVSNKEVRSLR